MERDRREGKLSVATLWVESYENNEILATCPKFYPDPVVVAGALT